MARKYANIGGADRSNVRYDVGLKVGHQTSKRAGPSLGGGVQKFGAEAGQEE